MISIFRSLVSLFFPPGSFPHGLLRVFNGSLSIRCINTLSDDPDLNPTAPKILFNILPSIHGRIAGIILKLFWNKSTYIFVILKDEGKQASSNDRVSFKLDKNFLSLEKDQNWQTSSLYFFASILM